MKLLESIFFILFLSCISCVVYGQEAMSDSEFAKKIGYDAQLKKIENIYIHFEMQNDVAILDKGNLYDFILQRLKRVINDIEILPTTTKTENGYELSGPFRRTFDSNESYGLLVINVWTVGNQNQVALHIKYEFGTNGKNEMKTDAFLGLIKGGLIPRPSGSERTIRLKSD